MPPRNTESFGTHWLTPILHLQVGNSGFWFSSGHRTCLHISITWGWLPGKTLQICASILGIWCIYYLLMVNIPFFLQNLQALMNECIGHVIGKPHSPVTGLYIGKMLFCDTNCKWLLGHEFRIYFSVYILVQVYNLGVLGTGCDTTQTRQQWNNNPIFLE